MVEEIIEDIFIAINHYFMSYNYKYYLLYNKMHTYITTISQINEESFNTLS